MKKYSTGGLFGPKPKKEKTKERSADGNYVTKTVTRTYDSPSMSGTKTKVKSRRTAEGVLYAAKPGRVEKTDDVTKKGKRIAIAPGPNFKKGGSVKKKK